MRSLKSFVLNSVLYSFAPYLVYVPSLNKYHFSWSYGDALGWVKCYSVEHFGRVEIRGFNRDLLAIKF